MLSVVYLIKTSPFLYFCTPIKKKTVLCRLTHLGGKKQRSCSLLISNANVKRSGIAVPVVSESSPQSRHVSCILFYQVYHSFHDEVDVYRQHWWRCDGPCRTRKPFFGYVKRAMNRAPSARDPWWEDHRRTCGGTYTKIKEPENYGKKGKSEEKKDKNASKKPGDKIKPGRIYNIYVEYMDTTVWA